MSVDYFSYYALTIHPSTINVFYQSVPGPRCRNFNTIDHDSETATTIKQPIQFKDNFHHGRMSGIAKRKMSKSLDYLIYLAGSKSTAKPLHGKNNTFKVNFITLTLSSPQIHSDQEIKKVMLNQFLIEMTKRWNVTKYVWKAEKQDNGNIHFHIVTGNFIPWNELRNVWNRIQQKLGYVTRYRENREDWHKHGFKYDEKRGSKWPYSKQLKAYKVGLQTGWDNPNSIDVHSLRNIGNIKSYMIKYMSKNKEYSEKEIKEFNELPELEKEEIKARNEISGRLWSCSNNLVKLKGGEADCGDVIYEELTRLEQNDKNCRFDGDYYHVYRMDINVLIKLNCFALLSVFEDYIRQKFPDDYLKVIL